jgi:cytochrome c biogenesis protein CcdA
MDPFAAVAIAIKNGSPLAIGAIFAAGVASSLGPCVAPRYLAVAGFASSSPRPTRAAFAFVAGLIGAYAVLGFSFGWLGSVRSPAGIIDGAMAIALLAAGSILLWRSERSGGSSCSHGGGGIPSGAPFLLGAGSAFVVSPCCTPILAAIVATASELGRPLAGAGVLACFALGHAVPLFAVGAAGSLFKHIRLDGPYAQAPAVIGGSLLLCLGAYYGVIA